jgi:hypothetical protein
VACGEDGIASFDHIRYRHHDASVFLFAFDLIELDGDDLRREPLAVRKATLASLLARAAAGLGLNEHLEEQDGPLVFAHACKLGLEGIVSKRRNSSYRSGRSPDWIKVEEPGGTSSEAGSGGGQEPVTFHSRAVFWDRNRINANQASASLNQAFSSIGLKALAAFWRHSSTLA